MSRVEQNVGGVWDRPKELASCHCLDPRSGTGSDYKKALLASWIDRMAVTEYGRAKILERISELEDRLAISVPLVAESSADIEPAEPQAIAPVDLEGIVGEVIVFRTRLGWELGTVDGAAPNDYLRVYSWPNPHPSQGTARLRLIRQSVVVGLLFGTRWQNDQGRVVRFAATAPSPVEDTPDLLVDGASFRVPVSEFLSRWQREEVE